MDRLRTVESTAFQAQRLLTTRGEVSAFYAARRLAGETSEPELHVMAQVGYAELFFAVGGGYADKAINGLRCDIAVVRRSGWPRMIIEVHGAGHFGDSDDKRREVEINDAIKRHVCKSANIQLLELVGNVTFASAYARIRLAGLLVNEPAARRA